jgi:hypothetical protein
MIRCLLHKSPVSPLSNQPDKAVDSDQALYTYLMGSFDWSRRPTETRLSIRGYYLTFTRAITHKSHDHFLRMQVLRLLFTKAEAPVSQAEEFYYGKNTFRLTLEDLVKPSNSSLQIGQHIRRLEVEMLSSP